MAKVLVASSDESIREEISSHMPDGHDLVVAHDFMGTREEIWKSDLVIADMVIASSLALTYTDVPVILATRNPDALDLESPLMYDIWDVLCPPFSRWQIELAIRRVQKYARIRNRPSRSDIGEFVIGRSAAMQQAFELASRIAASQATVLIQGETGTGKEVIARYIHNTSDRAGKPFIAVNCGALTETLLEDELFGHEKGSFTDAYSERMGRFELADKGTLFLDEVSTLSLHAQVKLLRVLQESEFERIGGTKSIKVDVRIIAASNENIQEAVKRGTFREDLFYRLNVVKLELPPLRDRKEDIPDLVDFFVKKHSLRHEKEIETVSDRAMNALVRYDYPGNIRELENIIERAVILAEGPIIQYENLPPHIRIDEDAPNETIQASGLLIPFGMKMSDIEKMVIKDALRRIGGDKTKAAQILGISRRTIYRKLQDESDK